MSKYTIERFQSIFEKFCEKARHDNEKYEYIPYEYYKKIKECLYGKNLEKIRLELTDTRLFIHFYMGEEWQSVGLSLSPTEFYKSTFGSVVAKWLDNCKNIYLYREGDEEMAEISINCCANKPWDHYTNGLAHNGTWSSSNDGNKSEPTENSRKEVKDMFNLDFGKCGKNFKLSMYGIAVKGDNGTYVAYDPASRSIVDVEVFNFEHDGLLLKMPVALSGINAGDVVIHMGKPMYVLEVCDSVINVVDIAKGEEKYIKPVKNMFGFNYYTKVVNLLGSMNFEADEDNPFGNMWMLAAAGSNGSNMLPLMMLMNKDAANFDPMMMMLLCSKNIPDEDLLPLFLLQSGRLIK